MTDELNWPGRPDPVDTYGLEGEQETNFERQTLFDDDFLSESENDIDIDASHILGENLSSDEDSFYGKDPSINQDRNYIESNYFESDDNQTERDSVDEDSVRHRIDPSAHEPSRYDNRYRIKPDPHDEDYKPDPFDEENKEYSFHEASKGSNSRIGENSHDDDGRDIENPSVSYRTFDFDDEKNNEFSQGTIDKVGSFGDTHSRAESRGESGIEVEEIVEFDSISKKIKKDLGFDDEPKEESIATVRTSRERRIITFLSVFVCCLVTILIIAIAVGIGLGLKKGKKTEPVPTSPNFRPSTISSVPANSVPIVPPSGTPSFTPSSAPTIAQSNAPTVQVTSSSPTPKPSFSPTRGPTGSPLMVGPPPEPYSTTAPTAPPVMEPQIPSTIPVTEPSPIGVPPGSSEITTPSSALPTSLHTDSSDSQNTGLLQFLIVNSLDEGEAVMKVGAPQNEAYKWLMRNAFLSIYSDEQILSRYSLATFFYATNGPTTWASFIREDGWLTDAPECEWGSTANNQCTKGLYTSLTLDFVGVSGTIPQELGLLTGLERLSIRGNVDTNDIVSGTIPDVFESFSNMQTIRLNDNQLFGSIPASFGSLKNCLVLIFSGNSLTGRIPKELNKTQARTLNFSNNQLSGQIPSDLFSLTKLRVLNLQNNFLSGTLPTEIGDVTSISNINFSNNQMGGTIPSEIGNLVEIRSAINLSSNKFSGVIPSELGYLNKMKSFEAQNNLLAGSIPAQLSNLTNIELFRIENNNGIIGSMPEPVCDVFSMTTVSYSDCGLESFQCDCCTYCCDGEVCECNIANVNICGEDLIEARAPF